MNSLTWPTWSQTWRIESFESYLHLTSPLKVMNMWLLNCIVYTLTMETSPESPIRITWPGNPFMFFKFSPLDTRRSGLEFMTHRPSSRFQSLRILSWWIVQSHKGDAFKRLGAGQRTKQWLISGPDFWSEIEGTSISLGWNLTRNLSFDF